MFDEEAFTKALYNSLPPGKNEFNQARMRRAYNALGSCGLSADSASRSSEEFTTAFSDLASQALEDLLPNPHERATVLSCANSGVLNFYHLDQ